MRTRICGRAGLVLLGMMVCALVLAAASADTAGAAGPGLETFASQIASEDGSPATQAGSHPYDWTVTIALDHHPSIGGAQPDIEVQNLDVDLPLGLLVNPSATTTRCPEAVLEKVGGVCPSSSVVGEDFYRFGVLGAEESTLVYNMETPPNEPAELGFEALFEGIVVHIMGGVRTGANYGLVGEVPDINQQVHFLANTLTLCGGEAAVVSVHPGRVRCGKPEGGQRPFLTLPTSCGSPLTTTLSANSWQDPAAYSLEGSASSDDSEGNAVPVTGCEKLSFAPSLTVQPATHAASSPTGLSVEMTVPQEESYASLAEADLREAVVTLPAGMAVSPAAADGGLAACALLTGKEGEQEEREDRKEVQGINLESRAPANCPEAAKIGSMEIETPLLEVPLKGSVYLAQQGTSPFPALSNPFGSLIALYLVLEGKGVVIKVPGEVSLDSATGQLTTRFGEDAAVEAANPAVKGHLLLPQLPFSHLKLDFFGGPRAALTTPPACGSYTVTSQLTPYSAPESGPPATPSSTFEIDEHCNGGQFNPTFNAGTTNNQAGAFSPFALTGFREDGEQNVSRLQVSLPPGLLGSISGIPLCEEPQADAGSCGQASLIGHVTVGVGSGPDPLYVTGEVFLTGPYKGAPFGLSVRVPAVAGPFNLGTVVVRSAIDIDPATAALTVTTDASGPYAIPRILDGIPVQIKALHVSVDRQDFTFNPTTCNPTSISASLTSAQGASASLSQRFQATNCAALAFKPKFTVSTSGKTSKANGASLDAKVVYPAGSWGTEANIAKVKVDLPKQLPSRLTTLQKACIAAVFETNPAGCPAASVIGVVKATTPVLPVELTGPVYFVSHGGEAFPSLVIVLQGEGVRVDLTAATFISKAGITSSTFNSIPDVPVSSFELYLPEGRYSALAANGNLCKSSLKMPTTFVAQNGAEIHQSTAIAISGCPKPIKKPQKARKPSKARKASKGRRALEARKAGRSGPVGMGGR